MPSDANPPFASALPDPPEPSTKVASDLGLAAGSACWLRGFGDVAPPSASLAAGEPSMLTASSALSQSRSSTSSTSSSSAAQGVVG